LIVIRRIMRRWRVLVSTMMTAGWLAALTVWRHRWRWLMIVIVSRIRRVMPRWRIVDTGIVMAWLVNYRSMTHLGGHSRPMHIHPDYRQRPLLVVRPSLIIIFGILLLIPRCHSIHLICFSFIILFVLGR
jgi:hypothetical protein